MALLVAWLLWDVVYMNRAARHDYFGSGDGTVVLGNVSSHPSRG